ncbi:MAG: Uma2 family endonuclease [Snowella sp.]|nr:Uma2 family endonuclease [Snowella sp.]
MPETELQTLPSSKELIDSDDIPVDNEDQNFIPNFLLFLLEFIWKQREDWFFAADMGIYHTTGPNPRVPVVPDGFLSLGVERRKGGKSRRSYVQWEEQNIVPILVLEVVSHAPGGEYEEKIVIYRQLGVKYYVIYNPYFWRRDGHLPFEVYKLIDGEYQLQLGEPFWMPEVGLGIGRCALPLDPLKREVLSWFKENGDRYLTLEEQLNLEKQRADEAQQELAKLRAQIEALGIQPNQDN